MAHVQNSITQEIEAGGLPQVQDKSVLHNEFTASHRDIIHW